MSCNDSSIPPPPPSVSLESTYRHQVAQYVIVACLALCVWDWLIAVSDELEMVRHGERRLRYLVNGLYLIARFGRSAHLQLLDVFTIDSRSQCLDHASCLRPLLHPPERRLFVQQIHHDNFRFMLASYSSHLHT